MTTAGGGWTFVAHIAAILPPPSFLSADVGSYRSDRIDDGTTYGKGGTTLPFVGHAATMVTLDVADPIAAAAASKLVIYSYGAGATTMNGGPVPCSGVFSGEVSYRTVPTATPTLCGPTSFCSTTNWYPRSSTGAYLVLFNSGTSGAFWGAGLGGDESWGHTAWWYVR
jgi:hypothetical protein